MANSKLGFIDYFKSAFNIKVKVKLLGDIPINWLALLGLTAISIPTGNLFLLLIGAGVELAYLYGMTTNPRFQKYLKGIELLKLKGTWEDQKNAILEKVNSEDRVIFFRLEDKCRKIKQLEENLTVDELSGSTSSIKDSYSNLEELLWVSLKLLLTKKIINEFVKNESQAQIKEKIRLLEENLTKETSERAIKSCQSTLEILKKRLENLTIADEKLRNIDLEILRIGEQLDLVINEAALSKDPAGISEKLDVIASGLGETAQWIKTSASIFRSIDDRVEEGQIGLLETIDTNTKT